MVVHYHSLLLQPEQFFRGENQILKAMRTIAEALCCSLLGGYPNKDEFFIT